MTGDILARLQAAQSDAEREWVVMEWSLANLKPEVREAVWAAAIPHWFDLDYLAALLDRPAEEVQPIYQRLITLSYVEVFPGRGYNVHERTRNLLLERLWRDNQQHFRILSDRAAGFSLTQDQEVIAWRVEAIFQLLIARPEQATELFRTIMWDWFDDYASEETDILTRTVLEHAALGRLSEVITLYVLTWRVALGLFIGDFGELYSHIDVSEFWSDQSEIAVVRQSAVNADSLFLVGSSVALAGDIKTANASYVRALRIYQEIGDRYCEARCLSSLASWQWLLTSFEQSLDHFQSARMVYRSLSSSVSESTSLAGAASALVMLERYDDAIDCYNQVLAMIQPNQADWYLIESKIGLAAAQACKESIDKLDLFSVASILGFVNGLTSLSDEVKRHPLLFSRSDILMYVARLVALLGLIFLGVTKGMMPWDSGNLSDLLSNVKDSNQQLQSLLSMFDFPVNKSLMSEFEALKTQLPPTAKEGHG